MMTSGQRPYAGDDDIELRFGLIVLVVISTVVIAVAPVTFKHHPHH